MVKKVKCEQELKRQKKGIKLILLGRAMKGKTKRSNARCCENGFVEKKFEKSVIMTQKNIFKFWKYIKRELNKARQWGMKLQK